MRTLLSRVKIICFNAFTSSVKHGQLFTVLSRSSILSVAFFRLINVAWGDRVSEVHRVLLAG